MTLAGCWLALRAPNHWLQWSGFLQSGRGIASWRWLLLSISITSMYGLIYLLNQIKDIKTDSINEKLFLVAEGALSRRHLIIEAGILTLAVAVFLFLSRFTHLGLLALSIFVIIGILYNFTPLALAGKPWGGLTAYLIGGWMALQLGEMIYGESISLRWEIPYLIAFVSSCIVTNLPDKPGDMSDGKMTFAVVHSERGTLIVGAAGFFLAAVVGVFNRDWVIVLPAAMTTPGMLAAYLKQNVELSIRVNKWAIFLLSVSVGAAFGFPVYLIIIGLYYPFARWYHRNRFGMAYPSFRC